MESISQYQKTTISTDAAERDGQAQNVQKHELAPPHHRPFTRRSRHRRPLEAYQ